MADVFISYAHQDSDTVQELAPALEAAGYSTWYYEDKGALGASYLRQIDEEIERCQAVVVVISPESVGSDQVSKEVVRAHEGRKKFIPVRRGISHDDFRKRQPEWRMAFGAAVSAEVPDEGVTPLVPRIVAGLRKLGVEPGAPPALPSARGAAAPPRGKPAGAATAVAAAVGALGLPYTLFHLSRVLSPAAGTPEGWVLATFPGFRTATTLVNVAGVAQNALLLLGAWLAYRRDARGAPLIRTVAISMLVAVGLWLLVSLSAFSGDAAQAAIPDAARRGGLIQATILTALLGLVPSGLVFALFRNASKR
jgi:hypothetical protein